MSDISAAERELADSALKALIDKLGLAFHPEIEVETYITRPDGDSHDMGLIAAMNAEELLSGASPTFSDEDAKFYQACLDIAWHVYGDKIFDEIAKHEPWKTYFKDQHNQEEGQ